MKTQLTRRGNTQRNQHIVICPPCGESAAQAAKEGQNRKNTLWPLLPRLTAVLPPQGREMSRGFTLIELLVVILIIGILAAVALPQYQKAVEKAYMVETISYLEAIQKGVDLWLLQNGGFPTTSTVLLDKDTNLLDLDLPLKWENGYSTSPSKSVYVLPIQCTSSWCDATIWQELPKTGPDIEVTRTEDGWTINSYVDEEYYEAYSKRLKALYPKISLYGDPWSEQEHDD